MENEIEKKNDMKIFLEVKFQEAKKVQVFQVEDTPAAFQERISELISKGGFLSFLGTDGKFTILPLNGHVSWLKTWSPIGKKKRIRKIRKAISETVEK